MKRFDSNLHDTMDHEDLAEIHDPEYIQDVDILPPPVIKLEEGLYLPDLLSGKSVEFKVKDQPDLDIDGQEEARVYFTSEQILEYVRPECVGCDEKDTDDDLEVTPFSQLAKKFTNIGDDGKLKKRLMKEGTGDIMVPRTLVVLHYNAYMEFAGEPFDSTYLRKIPARFRLGTGACLIGVDLALLTMKKGECSQFLLHPDIAYGYLGCPPRIPKATTVLFEITLMQCTAPLETDAIAGLPIQEPEKLSFAEIMAKADAHGNIGAVYFQRGMYTTAIKKYEIGISLLRDYAVDGEKEDKERQEMMLKFYVNVATCCNKNGQSPYACHNSQKALEIDPRNTKAHFHYGRALLRLHDYPRSEYHLKIAHKNEINNECISAELSLLDEKWKAAKKDESAMCIRMMRHCKVTTPAEDKKKDMSEIDRQFLATFSAKLAKFEQGKNKRLTFPSGICLNDRDLIKEETLRRGLKFHLVRGDGMKGDRFFITKPDPKPEEVKK